jgi:hypothetical protein
LLHGLLTIVFDMNAAIQLNECRGEASSENFPSQVRAANSNGGGGDMDDILNRLGAVESSVSEIREQVIGIAATIPTLATKADIGDVRLEVSELRAEVRGIAAVIPHLATKADLSAEIGSVRTDLKAEIGSMGTEIGSVRTEVRSGFASLRAEIKASEVATVKWMIAVVLSSAGLAAAIARFAR